MRTFEKRLPHPRKAAGAQITQSRHGEVVTINTDAELFWGYASRISHPVLSKTGAASTLGISSPREIQL